MRPRTHRLTRIPLALGASLLALMAAACGPKAPARFPKPEKLDEIAAAPPPTPQPGGWRLSDAVTWTMYGPGRDRVDAAQWSGNSPWDAILADAVGASAGRVTATEAMHCVADEVARFALANDGEPVEDLLDFFSARCGADTAIVDTEVSTVEVSDDAPESGILASWKTSLTSALSTLTREPQRELGLSFARGKGKAVLAIVAGEQDARVEPISVRPDADGSVHLRGESLFATSQIEALVNQGRYETEPCDADPDVAPPSFSFTCHPLSSDASAWIEVDAVPLGHVLSRRVLSVLVFPGGAPSGAYTRPTVEGAVPDSAGDVESFLAALNAVRDQANLGRVHEAKEESAIATRLAPWYFAWMRESDVRPAETIALGLMAGWKIEDPLRYGKFTSTYTSHDAGTRRVLASSLSRPGGRSVLLDPDVSLVAIGRAALGERASGTLVTMFSVLNAESGETRTRKVMLALAKARKKKNLPPPRLLTTFPTELAQAITDVEARHKKPRKSLDALMHRIVTATRRPVRGYVMEAESLDDVRFHPELLQSPGADLAVAVAWVREKGEPWGHYVVMIVQIEGSPA